MKFSNSVTIARAPAEVFAFLADFEQLPRWNYALSATRKISQGPVGVGALYTQSRLLPAPSEESFEVTAFVPGRTLAITGQFGPFAGASTYEIVDAGAVTRLVNTMALEPAGVLRAIAPLAAAHIQAAVAANLAVLKLLIERGENEPVAQATACLRRA
jgi:uncharacterized protein YndB with AHSA1/START domain